jgi:hypothetical protein
MDLDKLNYAQRERLAFIDFCLQFTGQISRADLISHFGIGLASSSRDLTLYKELAPSNLVLEHKTKQYFRTAQFNPIFSHNSEAVLTSLSQGFGNGLSNGISSSSTCFYAARINHPNTSTIATLMRAINNKKTVMCHYISLSSGDSQREIVPHAIVNNGLRWHVRAYDVNSGEFRDFVCTRIQNAQEIQKQMPPKASANNDCAWQNIINIELVPHPSVKHKKAIELDYSMSNGILQLKVREALLGYLMRQWSVDCSEGASLNANEYHLWLSNIKKLDSSVNMLIAPGYK